MTFRKQDILFIIATISVIGILAALSHFGTHPQKIVPIPEHKDITKATTRTTCLKCHHPDTGELVKARLKVTHPQKWRDEKFSCIGCHQISTN